MESSESLGPVEPADYRFFSARDLPLQSDVPGARYFGVALSKAMLTYFELEPWSSFTEHQHESEQITLVLTGRLVFEIAGDRLVVGPGEVIAIGSNVSHAVTSLDETVTAVDAWSPPRASLVSPGSPLSYHAIPSSE